MHPRRLTWLVSALLLAALVGIGTPFAAMSQPVHRSTVVFLIPTPSNAAQTEIISAWFNDVAFTLNDLDKIDGLRQQPAGVFILPRSVKYDSELPTAAKLRSTQISTNAFQVIAPKLPASSASPTITSQIYLGDLRGPLSLDYVLLRQKVGANSPLDGDESLRYVTYYAIAMDAARFGDERGKCLILKKAEVIGRRLDVATSGLSPVRDAIAGMLSKCPK